MTQLLEFGGRLHPLLLHAPIGLFIGLLTLELITLLQRGHKPIPAPKVLVLLTAFTSVASAAAGLLLAREDGYGGDGLELHRWSGIVAGVLSVAMAAFRMGSPRQVKFGYHAFLALFGACLIVTGHLGGAITHGDDFLFAPFEPKRPKRDTQPLPDDTFAPVSRILAAKCVSCHGPDKRKGGLALHSIDAIMTGGDTGPAVVMGSPEDSELMVRLLLPIDDEDHMPPAKKQQLSAEEIQTIEGWIAGTPMTFDHTPEPEVIPDAEPRDPAPPPPPARPVPDANAIARLGALRAHVEVVDPESGALWIDLSNASPAITPHDSRELLGALKPFIRQLTLARTALPEDLPSLLSGMDSLERLDLRQTEVTDADLGALAGLPKLTELVLAQTKVTDVAVESIAMVPTLRRVYLWGTGMTPEGAARLRAMIPGARLDLGDVSSAPALETEGEIALTSDAPAPDQAAPKQASLTPINPTCPVSGSPIDPKYSIVYEGKVIGFCCPNCPRQFWAEPEKFLTALGIK
ncbi:MAG: c-type cytochrome domain-containing protein [Phycisphaerales bacterium]